MLVSTSSTESWNLADEEGVTSEKDRDIASVGVGEVCSQSDTRSGKSGELT
jgi:hypothetical protein